MAQAQRADAPEEPKQGFSNRPTIIADNGHGTKVKLWSNDSKNGEFQTVSIERSFQRQGSDQWETQKVTLNASDRKCCRFGFGRVTPCSPADRHCSETASSNPRSS